MRAVLRENLLEALIGLLVVALALWFVYFAWQRTGGGGGSDYIRVSALFPNVAGVGVGTDVRIAGMKIGSVADEELDPKTFQAKVTLALDPKTKVPADSSAAITSEGLLGSTYIAVVPGGDPTPLKNGDTIVDTQGAVDLMSMVGQYINKSGGAAAPANGMAAESAAGVKP